MNRELLMQSFLSGAGSIPTPPRPAAERVDRRPLCRKCGKRMTGKDDAWTCDCVREVGAVFSALLSHVDGGR